MSNKSIENLIESMTALFISTIQSQPENKGKISVDEIIASVNSEDLQSQMKKVVSEKLPKNSRSPKEKKLKDENAPKRPKSAYMFFAEKKRPEIREEQPDLKMIEISKVIGQRWKEVTPEGRVKYDKKAAADKERYDEEMKEYVRPSDEVLMEQKINQKKRRKSSGEPKKTRAKKPEGAPKGAKSAYMFFCAAKRDEVKEAFPDYKMVEVTKELARMWKEDFSAEEDREEYVKQAAEDKERFAQEKAEWEATHPSEVKPPKGKKGKAKESPEAKAKESKAKDSKAKDSKTSKAEASKAKASKAKAASESDSDDDEPSPKLTTKPAPKLAPKPVIAKPSLDSDSDDDEPQSKTVLKPAPKKQMAKAAVSSSDESSDVDTEPEDVKPAAKPAKAAPKPPAKNTVQIPSFVGNDAETSSDDE